MIVVVVVYIYIYILVEVVVVVVVVVVEVAGMDSELISKKRTIKFRWPLDMDQTHEVQSFAAEMNLVSKAHLKARLSKEVLPEVPWMEGLNRPTQVMECNPDLLSGFQKARNLGIKIANGLVTKGKDFWKDMEKKRGILINLDDSFGVELASLKAVMGPEGVVFIQDKILEKLPEGPTEATANGVLTELQVLKALVYEI